MSAPNKLYLPTYSFYKILPDIEIVISLYVIIFPLAREIVNTTFHVAN